MENPSSEINDYDWEIIPNSSPPHPPPSSTGGSAVIRSDHFSLDPNHNYAPANDAAATGTIKEGDDGDSDSRVHPSCSSVVARNTHQGFSEINDKSSEIVQNSEGEGEGEGEGEVSKSIFEGEEKKRVVVWWKVPMEVVKYCVMRLTPVWSISMAAAALMGLVLLRRRYLYKLKRKMQGIQLNVTLDNDKKVSQLMSRTALLNEAFSVVKRIPIIRPALPAPGMTSWPVTSLR